jgi:hypothetical protein
MSILDLNSCVSFISLIVSLFCCASYGKPVIVESGRKDHSLMDSLAMDWEKHEQALG